MTHTARAPDFALVQPFCGPRDHKRQVMTARTPHCGVNEADVAMLIPVRRPRDRRRIDVNLRHFVRIYPLRIPPTPLPVAKNTQLATVDRAIGTQSKVSRHQEGQNIDFGDACIPFQHFETYPRTSALTLSGTVEVRKRWGPVLNPR
jgi:hypothetical protein